MRQQCLLNIHAFDPTAHHARFCIKYANQCRRLMAGAFFFLAIISYQNIYHKNVGEKEHTMLPSKESKSLLRTPLEEEKRKWNGKMGK